MYVAKIDLGDNLDFDIIPAPYSISEYNSPYFAEMIPEVIPTMDHRHVEIRSDRPFNVSLFDKYSDQFVCEINAYADLQAAS